MNHHIKLSALKNIYAIYEEFSVSLDVSCQKGCAACCTRNVTLTTLEGRHIVDYIGQAPKKSALERLSRDQHLPRFQPKITLNGLAELFIKGQDGPDEEYHLEGECPLLENHLCTIYPVRPFGCRCFLSETDCSKTGSAHVDPFVVTVNNLLLQFIEHLDSGGATGNLTDILLFLARGDHDENLDMPLPVSPVRNRPIPALLIPPEHQERIKGLLSKLQSIHVPAA